MNRGILPTPSSVPELISKYSVASQTEMLLLQASTGEVCKRNDFTPPKYFMLSAQPAGIDGNWFELSTPGFVSRIGNKSGVIENLEVSDVDQLQEALESKSNDGHEHIPVQVGLHPASVDFYGQLAQLGRGREFGGRQVIVTAYGNGSVNTVAIHRDGAAVSRSTSATNRNAVYTVPSGYVAMLVYVAMSNTTAAGIPTQIIGPGQHRATTVAANSAAATGYADGIGTQGGITIATELARSLTPLAAGESIGFESSSTGLLTSGVFYTAVIVEIPDTLGKLGTATNFGTRTAGAAILYTCPTGKIAYTVGQGAGKSAHASFRVWVTHTTATIIRVYKLDSGETTSAVADNRLVWQYGSANMGNWGGFVPTPITLRAGESIAVDQSAGASTNAARVLVLELDL